MRTILMMSVLLACALSVDLAFAGCGGEVQATCNSATGACGAAATARVRTVVRQRTGILAKIGQASKASSCGQAVQSCGQAVQSCGQAVQSCQQVQSCAQVSTCSQSTQCESGTFGCGATASSCGAGLGAVAGHGGLAQQKANQQASNGRMQHLGGGFGGGSKEGVGFSTVSADDAIRRCCYYGQYTPREIGVARGNNGWYATVLY